MDKMSAFLKMNIQTKILILESYFYLAWARILKHRSFAKVAPTLGERTKETPMMLDSHQTKVLQNISETIRIASRYTLWESQCLVQAIAAMKMLERRKIESTLYLGMTKDETGQLIAHAWLRSGTFYITGSKGKEHFTIVNTFAKYI